MAISKLVDYEATTTHELQGPDKSPLGIHYTVRSDKCQAAINITRKVLANRLAVDAVKDKNSKVFEDMLSLQEALSVDKLVACLVSIDWGVEEWEYGGGPLPDTKAGKTTFCKTDWIFPQIKEKIEALGGFTKA